MHTSPSKESLKEKAKMLRQFMKEKHLVDVPHGQCLELVSKLFGYHDWNTASAEAKARPEHQSTANSKVDTIGDLKAAIAKYKDSDSIDFDYDFKVSELLEKLEEDGDDEADIYQTFSVKSIETTDRIVSFKLQVEYEDLFSEELGMGRTI